MALPAVLTSEVGYTRKTIERKRLAPDSLTDLVLAILQWVFSWTMCFCQDVADHCTLAGSADFPPVVCRDRSTPPLLGSEHGLGSAGFRWSCADNFGCIGSRRTLHNGHESFLALSNRGALSILMQASSLRGRLTWFQESFGQLCVWSKEHLEESYVFSAFIGVFAGLMSASVRMHQKRASRSRFVKDVASWLRMLVGSQGGQGSSEVPGHVRFAPARRKSVWRMRCRLPRERERRGLPRSVAATSESLWMELVAYGGFAMKRSTFYLVCCQICRLDPF